MGKECVFVDIAMRSESLNTLISENYLGCNL